MEDSIFFKVPVSCEKDIEIEEEGKEEHDDFDGINDPPINKRDGNV